MSRAKLEVPFLALDFLFMFALSHTHTIIFFLTATFGSSAYVAHLDLVEETSTLDERAKILELKAQRAILTIQALQINSHQT